MLSAEKSDNRKWKAVETRDRAADGTFYYSVKTTGVYCKPSCAGRPRRENVAFHATAADAERAGFRACKRCRPNEPMIEIAFMISESALGPVAIAATEKGVCAILFGRDMRELRHDLEKRFQKTRLTEGGNTIARLTKDVIAFLDNPRRQSAFALDMSGTDFQRKVWQALRKIPAGSTASYAEIARKIGEPKASRAVAQACGANLLAVAIPCHRVVRSDGSLSGYRWGEEKKLALLAREAA
jgi:AraC family transcriptional regulator, regulatory protein of adaptative response / methylated-DNA-[protein]-cysteine methyltransferase